MKRALLSFLGIFAAVAAVSAPVPAAAKTDFNVNVNLGPPPVVVEAPPAPVYAPPRVVVEEPPEMVVIPRSTIYFAPGLSVDLFFNDGWWWTRDRDRWYRSRDYRGSWVYVDPPRVPREIIRVRPDYRNYYVRERHIPYGQFKKHWREHREDWKEDKHERKMREKEMKREWKRDRDDDDDQGRGHGRGRGRD